MRKQKNEKNSIIVDKRQRILDAAIRVFAHKGYTMAKIAEIAQIARVATGTVYIYFESKDDLLLHCMREVITSKLESIRAAGDPAEPAMERLYHFFIRHVEMFWNEPYLARFLVVEVRQNEEFYQRNPEFNPMNAYLEFVQELAREAIDEGSITLIDPVAFSYLIIGAMDMILTQWLSGNNEKDMMSIIDDIRNILQYGVKRNEAAIGFGG